MSVKKHHFMVHCRDMGHAVFKIPHSADIMKPRRDRSELAALKRRMHKRYAVDPVKKPAARPNRPEIDPDAPQELD